MYTLTVAMYKWTEHPDWTPDLHVMSFQDDGTENLIRERHRVSEPVTVNLPERSAQESTLDALTVIAKLKSEQVTEHVSKMQALNEAEAKYLCLTHEVPSEQDMEV
jgi:hypothetical protein